MITSAHITGGFAKDLPGLKGKINLSPGINVLMGENGSGKTTLLRLLAAYSGCPESGWSRWPTPLEMITRDMEKEREPYPEAFSALRAASGCEADVRWDGTASYFSDTVAEDAPVHDFRDQPGTIDVLDKILTMRETSSGQFRMVVLASLFKKLKDVPDLTNCSDEAKHMNSTWQAYAKAFEDHVKTLPPTGIPTVLLDEPDRGLSPRNQALFWASLAKMPTLRYQMVIATHSVFAATLKDAKMIELSSDFGDFAESLSEASAIWSDRRKVG